jgi:hypothetical protein
MKKITLLVASILLTASVANATEVIRTSNYDNTMRFSFEEPISFIERGIEFFVFPNGDFDFNTRPDDSQGDYFYRTAGRKGTVTASRRPVNYGVRIEHDSFGRVRRVGNTFINYDYNDRVSRIGSIYMRYNRFALAQIGGMRIIYNRNGAIVDMIGSVKGRGNYGFTYNYATCDTDDYDYNQDYATAYNSKDYYYYRHDGSRAKIEEKK